MDTRIVMAALDAPIQENKLGFQWENGAAGRVRRGHDMGGFSSASVTGTQKHVGHRKSKPVHIKLVRCHIGP